MRSDTFHALKKNAEHPKPTAFGQALASAFKVAEKMPHKPQDVPKAVPVPDRQSNGFKPEGA